MILKARFVVPIDGPAIENGAIAIEDDRITAVGLAGEISSDPPTIDYGDAVICPGFVNAHTHLELSLLAGRVSPSPDFTHWLCQLNKAIGSELSEKEQTHTAVRAGIEQSLSSGVTALGDISRRPRWTRETLAQSPLRGVSFGEVIAIGNRRHLLTERLEEAASTKWQSDRLRIGISPHAPYSVAPDAMQACAHRAEAIDAPVCIHLAETAEEERFTRSCEGPFAELLRTFGVWDRSIQPSGCGPVALARRAGLLTRRTIIAHANYVDDNDIQLLAETEASVAYCPHTHKAFDHVPHRFLDMLDAGVNVCIGTDSLASSPTLSILDELRFLHREYPDVSADVLVAAGTLRGARALGLDDQAGSLAVGKRADLAVIPVEGSPPRGSWASILESVQPIKAVYISGERQ